MDWIDTFWQTALFGGLQLLWVAVLFFARRRLLWLAPVLSTACAVLLTLALIPEILDGASHGSIFWGITLPMHIGIALALTALAGGVALLLKKRSRP